MKINYRIDDLELRLNDIPDVEPVLHSPFSEIVQWSSNSTREYCWTIASIDYDKDGYPELRYCGNRPLDLTVAQTKNFQSLIIEAYKYKLDNGKITKMDEA